MSDKPGEKTMIKLNVPSAPRATIASPSALPEVPDTYTPSCSDDLCQALYELESPDDIPADFNKLILPEGAILDYGSLLKVRWDEEDEEADTALLIGIPGHSDPGNPKDYGIVLCPHPYGDGSEFAWMTLRRLLAMPTLHSVTVA